MKDLHEVDEKRCKKSRAKSNEQADIQLYPIDGGLCQKYKQSCG